MQAEYQVTRANTACGMAGSPKNSLTARLFWCRLDNVVPHARQTEATTVSQSGQSNLGIAHGRRSLGATHTIESMRGVHTGSSPFTSDAPFAFVSSSAFCFDSLFLILFLHLSTTSQCTQTNTGGLRTTKPQALCTLASYAHRRWNW